MFSPPPGWDDLLADVEGYAPDGPITVLDVPEVGAVRARRPGPAGIAALAMTARPELGMQERMNYLVQFVSEHVDAGEMERLYLEMMMDRFPADTMERTARELATWGTSRPYVAVVTLAVITGHHWRALRNKLIMAGIPAPLETIRSMHPILDVTETLVVDALVNADDAERELATFYRRLYGPSPEAAALNGDAKPPIPAGFSPDEVEDSFDAFARVAR